MQFKALRGLRQPAAIVHALQLGDLLGKVQLRVHGRDLPLQQLDQFMARAHRNAGNVVDGLVAVQLRALPAHMGQGIDDMAADALQPQLEHLEQARRACAYDEGIGLDRLRAGGVLHGLRGFSVRAGPACRACRSSRRRRAARPCAW